MDAHTVIACLSQLFALFGFCGYIHSDRGTSFMSSEFVTHMNNLGIATSRTSIYNPRGNGQCERYNEVIWSSVKLSLRTHDLPISHWEVVLPEALHSIRSLLCTATNTTPHERFLNFQRRSALGTSVSTWLCNPDRILVKRHNRASKYEPLVNEAELMLLRTTLTFVSVTDENQRFVYAMLHRLRVVLMQPNLMELMFVTLLQLAREK